MTYYEEFGLDDTATAEQIRRAYRKLVTLLHPDHQQDETLRRICERQLARINGIAEILNDPERRQEYDLRLQQEERNAATGWRRVAQAREFIGRQSLAARVWALAALAGMMLMALLFRWNAVPAGDAPYRAQDSGERAIAVARGTPSAETDRGRAKAGSRPERPSRPRASRTPVLAIARSPGQEIVTAPVRNVPKSEPPPVSGVVIKAPAPARAIAVPVANSEQAATEPSQRQSYFAGDWFFLRSANKAPAALYPPEMIEMTITEADGVLRGKYRSRYRVADQPISPDVSFQFGGPAAPGDDVELEWRGAEGAEGQIRLKVMTPLSMTVSWWATRKGGLDLTSGTAVLIRARER
jgi:curved DNA-binding protein CbpA